MPWEDEESNLKSFNMKVCWPSIVPYFDLSEPFPFRTCQQFRAPQDL